MAQLIEKETRHPGICRAKSRQQLFALFYSREIFLNVGTHCGQQAVALQCTLAQRFTLKREQAAQPERMQLIIDRRTLTFRIIEIWIKDGNSVIVQERRVEHP